MITARSIEQARDVISSWRRAGASVSLVPTMGYFHQGHVELMKRAKAHAEKAVVSLFVNPTQFGPHEDLAVYPRDFEGDRAKAEDAGVDLMFCPEKEEMYKPGHQTTVSVADLSTGLCGTDRPGHFAGVATVVTKLFNIIQPDCAVFGQKDFQQLVILRRLVADLNMTVEIIGHPIVREPDGLAMSSRNAYLTSSDRAVALVLYRTMTSLRETIRFSGEPGDVKSLLEKARADISADRRCSLDYLTIVREETLEPCLDLQCRCRIMGAIKINGRVRLIDNMPLYD